jgi:hypothetical protein
MSCGLFLALGLVVAWGSSEEKMLLSEVLPGRKLASYPPYLPVPGLSSIQLCPGDILEVSMCPTVNSTDSNVVCSGNPLLSLANSSGNTVAVNDNYCGDCPSLLFTADADSDCESIYSLNASCVSGSCSGTAGVRVTTTNCSLGAITTTLGTRPTEGPTQRASI